MAGIITVSPYIGIRPTELKTISVIHAEREMAGDDDGPVVDLCRLLELIESLQQSELQVSYQYYKNSIFSITLTMLCLRLNFLIYLIKMCVLFIVIHVLHACVLFTFPK